MTFKAQLKGEVEAEIEFLKYHFSDMQGHMREVTLTVDTINEDGITSVDGSSVFGKIIPPTESDMLLIPDPSTIVKIPWSEDTARVICNVYYPKRKEEGNPKPFEGCPRSILARVDKSLDSILKSKTQKMFPDAGKIERFHAHFAPEIEFILLDSSYESSRIHLDSMLKNDNYFIPPKEKVDSALKQMTKTLGVMGLKKEKFHTEVTTYQCEIGISHGNVLQIADGTMTLKYIIENIAQRNGLRASFIPKFYHEVNGSGMHVHQNLAATVDGEGKNLFYDPSKPNCLSDIGRQYIAGLLAHASEITAITNPVPVSYKRLVPGAEAPTYIAWDWKNRTALCRGHSEGTKKVRVEYRAPDPLCNPYLAFAAMLSAGLDGIERKLKLGKADNRNFYKDNKGVKELPGDLKEALMLMNESKMLRKKMGDFVISTIYELGNQLWREYSREVSDVDVRRFL